MPKEKLRTPSEIAAILQSRDTEWRSEMLDEVCKEYLELMERHLRVLVAIGELAGMVNLNGFNIPE